MSYVVKSISAFRSIAVVGGLVYSAHGPYIMPAADVLTVSASPAAMKVTTATAGSQPNAATNNLTTYTVNAKKATSPMKIQGYLSAVMPSNTALTINMVPPTGATPKGTVTLDGTARDLVGNITNTTAEQNMITYTLSATVLAGVVVSQSRTLFFTLVAGP